MHFHIDARHDGIMNGLTASIDQADRHVTLLVVGGTGESFAGDTRTEVSGLLAGVTLGLDARFRCRWVGYPASYGPAPDLAGISYLRSVEIGVDNLRTALIRTEGPVALIGYSQGAVVIRHALRQLADADHPAIARAIAVGFVADPHQPPGAVPGCAGWGVAGGGPELPSGIDYFWVGAVEDMICNASSDSFVRDIADITPSLAVGYWGEWLSHVWTVLRHNTFQNAGRTSLGLRQMVRDGARLVAAAREVLGYLPNTLRWGTIEVRNRRGGRHTSYAREPYRRHSLTDPYTTGCEALAAWLQVCATFSEVGEAHEAGLRDLVA